MPQLGASLTNIILTTLEVSFMHPKASFVLLENIYSTAVAHYDSHLGQGKSTALLSANVNVLSAPPLLLVTR